MHENICLISISLFIVFRLYIINTRIAGRTFVRDLISHCTTIVEFQLAASDSCIYLHVRTCTYASHEKGKNEEGFPLLPLSIRYAPMCRRRASFVTQFTTECSFFFCLSLSFFFSIKIDSSYMWLPAISRNRISRGISGRVIYCNIGSISVICDRGCNHGTRGDGGARRFLCYACLQSAAPSATIVPRPCRRISRHARTYITLQVRKFVRYKATHRPWVRGRGGEAVYFGLTSTSLIIPIQSRQSLVCVTGRALEVWGAPPSRRKFP